MKKHSAILFFSVAVMTTLLCTACGSKSEVPSESGSAAASTTEQPANSGSLTSSDLENFHTDSQEISDTDTPEERQDNAAPGTAQDIPAETTESGDNAEATSETPASSDGSLTTDGISISYGDYVIKVVSCKETVDINNCSALRVTYEFTNQSASQATFSTSIVTSAYQNEYRLANTSPQGSDPEYSAQLSFVQPGSTVTCASYYLLDNTTDDVNIQVTNLLNSSDESLSLRYRFNK